MPPKGRKKNKKNTQRSGENHNTQIQKQDMTNNVQIQKQNENQMTQKSTENQVVDDGHNRNPDLDESFMTIDQTPAHHSTGVDAENKMEQMQKMIDRLMRQVAILSNNSTTSQSACVQPSCSQYPTGPDHSQSMPQIQVQSSRNIPHVQPSCPQYPMEPDHVQRMQQAQHIPLKPMTVLNMPTLDTLLPKFGKEDNPKEFLAKVEDTFTSYSMPSNNWVLLLGPQFKGEVRNWYDSVKTKNYEEFKSQFLKKYDSLEIKIKLQAEYFGTKQQWQQPTRSFIQNKMHLLRRLFGEIDEAEAIIQLMELLHPKVKVHYVIPPTTLESFMDRGDIIDQSLLFNNQQSEQNPSFRNQRNSSSSNQQNLQVENSKPGYSTKNFSENSRKNCDIPEKRTPKCKHCVNQFHFFKDCPKLKNICSSEFDVLPRINVSVGKVNTHALLDTAANPNFINHSFLEESDSFVPNDEEISLAVVGNMIKILGKITKTIKVGTKEYECNFNVVHNLTESIILGKPFLEQASCLLDFNRNCLILGNVGRENVYFLGHKPQTTKNKLEIAEEQVDHDFPKDSKESKELFTLLEKYSHLFDKRKQLSQTDAIKHSIKLKTNRPIYVKQHKMSDEKKLAAERQIKEMLDQNIIEESSSPYSAPIVMVPQKEGKDDRFCVDFRQLNKVTYDEECQHLNIKELINNVSNNKVFSSLDLLKGYWQILLDDCSKEYTAFRSPTNKCYQFRVLPFGLKNAPGVFMRLMSKVLEGYIGHICEVFLDDILVYSQTREEHLHHLELILERLDLYGLTTAFDKCHFGKSSLKYLGHILTAEDTQAQDAHIQAIQSFAIPRTLKQLQSFIGTCNWLRDYVPNAAVVLAPLTSIIKQKPFKWSPTETEAFEQAKEAFSNLQPLHRPRKDLPLILQTDASNLGISITMYQEEGDKRYIISNASSKLNKTQQNYHVNEQECLAIIWAVKRYRSYLEGKKFIIRTDSRAVSWLHKVKEERSKLMRWALLLQEFNFVIEHVPGHKNELPDAMSRSPAENSVAESDTEDWDAMMPPNLRDFQETNTRESALLKLNIEPVSLIDDLKKAQQEDKYCKQNIDILSKGTNLANPGKFKLQNELLLENDKIVVPNVMVEKIINLHHDDELNNHPGTNETTRRVARKYIWKGMNRDIRCYVRRCEKCAQVKTAGRTIQAGLTPRKLIHPFHTVSIDLMGPYTRSRKGKKFLLVATDTFSKWTEAYPLGSATSGKIVTLLEQELFSRFGYPKVIISDNGPQFVSKIMKEACQRWKVTHHTTAIYTPRQSPVERQNQNIKNKLRLFLLDTNHNQWDENLDKILFSLRNATNTGTKFSPAQILFGRPIRHPGDLDTVEAKETCPTSYGEERQKCSVDINNQVKQNIEKYQGNYAKESSITLSPGQVVLIRNHILSNAAEGITSSLSPKWIGPYIVEKHIGANVYLCKNLDNHKDTRKVDITDIQLRDC